MISSSKSMRLSTVVVATVVAALLIPIRSGAVSHHHLHCGQVITTDTTLHHDLLDCPDDGLVIGADDITLNLNGHTIGGDATPISTCGPNAFCDVGVVNVEGYDSVTVEGGEIRQFSLGVLVDGGSHHSRLRALSISQNDGVGIIVANSTRAVIAHNRLPDDGISGLGLFSSSRARVVDNVVHGTTGYAVVLSTVRTSLIAHNVLRNDTHGFLVTDDSSRNKLRRNLIVRTGGGFDIGGGRVVANRIVDNRLVHDGDAILVVGARRTVIKGNRAVGTGIGFSDTGGFGILLDGALGTLVTKNQVIGGRGPAVWVTNLESPETPTGNVMYHNITNSRFDDGIRVDKGATHTILSGNRATHNGDDGLEVQASDTTLKGNVANFNVDLGIEAVPGVIDGGGNRAKGNGNPLQCTNVSCS